MPGQNGAGELFCSIDDVVLLRQFAVGGITISHHCDPPPVVQTVAGFEMWSI